MPADSTRAEYVTYPEDTYTRVEPGVAIGGPIKRDRAWLFAAYQPALTHTGRTVTFTFDESTATKASDETEHFFNVNQTTQVHDSLRTRVTLDWSPSRQDGMLPALDGATYPAGQLRHRRQAGELHRVGQRRLGGEAQAVRGHPRRVFHHQPHKRERHGGALFVFASDNNAIWMCPRSLQQVVGFQTDLTNDVSRVDRLSRVNAQVDATYFGSLAGQHTLKAGVQFDRRANDVDKGRAPTASTCSGTARSRASAAATAITVC